MHEGSICRVVVPRGFGFIASAGQPDTFFHMNDLIDLTFDELLMERRVKFDMITTEKGTRAKCVQAAG